MRQALRLLGMAFSASFRQHLAACVALLALLAVTEHSPVGPGQMVCVLLAAFGFNTLVVLVQGLLWARKVRAEVLRAKSSLLAQYIRPEDVN